MDALGLDNFTSSQIEKLSGDNTRDEKERVMDALRAQLNCSTRCSCKFANTGADESLARHLLPRISPESM